MRASLATAEIESAAQHLAEGMVRALPVTLARVALWEQPSFALTVRAVSAARQLPGTTPVGAHLPLATAPWHRAVFERQEPVLVEPAAGATPPAGGGDLAGPGLRSVYLLPIRQGGDPVGVVALGEMRSPTREPFSEAKRRRCVEVLEQMVGHSASVWQVGRLHRQVRAMSFLVRVVRQLADVRTADQLLGCLATGVADWVGTPVRGVLLRTGPERRAVVAARFQYPEPAAEAEAAQLVLAMARATEGRRGPVRVVRVADDPLDPLHGSDDGRGTRIGLPLLAPGGLLGVVSLHVTEDFCPASWEVEALRWVAEVASAWIRALEAADRALGDLVRRVTAEIPERLDRAARAVAPGDAEDGQAWRAGARAAAEEVVALLRELGRAREATPGGLGGSGGARS